MTSPQEVLAQAKKHLVAVDEVLELIDEGDGTTGITETSTLAIVSIAHSLAALAKITVAVAEDEF